jgi:hypothetical protein
LLYNKNRNIQSLLNTLNKTKFLKELKKILKENLSLKGLIDVIRLIERRGFSYRGKYEGINHLSFKTC